MVALAPFTEISGTFNCIKNLCLVCDCSNNRHPFGCWMKGANTHTHTQIGNAMQGQNLWSL